MKLYQAWWFRYSEFRMKITITTDDIKKRVAEVAAFFKNKKK